MDVSSTKACQKVLDMTGEKYRAAECHSTKALRDSTCSTRYSQRLCLVGPLFLDYWMKNKA